MRWLLTGLVFAALGVVSWTGTEAQDTLTPVLGTWIRQSRDAAIERGVDAMPTDMREAFVDFIPSDVLNSVRWRVDGETSLLGAILFQPGAVRAVTLDNVIVFANAEEAGNIKLWAHELFHVLQYSNWGIDGFAERFIADHRVLESEAYEFRWQWMKATGRVPEVPAR